MSKKLFVVMTMLVAFSMVLAACAPAATPVPTTAPTKAPTVAPTTPPKPTDTKVPPTATTKPTDVPKVFKACQVTDMGGINDKSFNATAWKGLQDAKAAYGIEIKYLESKQQTDYEKNINAFIDEKCDLIVPVGFLLGDATKAAAAKNPNVKFAIVDFTYAPDLANVYGSQFTIDQAAFLNGYLAAAFTKTGKVGTYGGIQIPPVTAFSDGFALGVAQYNKKYNKTVKVLGWDITTQKGLFTGDFDNLDKGKTTTLTLLDEGADVIMPVAGPVGQGTLAALRERKTGLMIGVDTDWSFMYKDYADVILSSVMKRMDKWVMDTVKLTMDGKFKGATYTGNLQNAGVALAVGSAFESKLTAELKADIEALKADIIAGKIATAPKK